jgi:hypothetical protein
VVHQVEQMVQLQVVVLLVIPRNSLVVVVELVKLENKEMVVVEMQEMVEMEFQIQLEELEPFIIQVVVVVDQHPQIMVD